MGTEKMDKCDGFGTTEGDYVYADIGGDCVSTYPAIGTGDIGTAHPTHWGLKPQTFAEIHASRVIDELWKMRENEYSGKGRIEILDAITNAAYYLDKMGE